MQLVHNMPYPGLREADRDIIKERKIRNMRRNLYDGGLTVNGDKKLAVFGIAAACAIGLINHMQYRNLAKRMEDLEVTVEMELFPDLAFPRIHTRKVREEEERSRIFGWKMSRLQKFQVKLPSLGMIIFSMDGRMTYAGGNE